MTGSHSGCTNGLHWGFHESGSPAISPDFGAQRGSGAERGESGYSSGAGKMQGTGAGNDIEVESIDDGGEFAQRQFADGIPNAWGIEHLGWP